MPLRELGVTHRGAADAWECDQMRHVNVRFLARRFAEAHRVALAMLGLTDSHASRERWSFQHEVRPGAALRIETSWDADGRKLLHRLFKADTPSPATTLACDFGPADQMRDRPGAGWAETGYSETGPHAGPGHEDMLRLANHAVAHLGLDEHRRHGPDGSLEVGSALVALDVYRGVLLPARARVAVQSRWGRAGHSSLRVLHRMRGPAGEVAAQVEAVHVLFDMQTRRPVPLPAALRNVADTGMDYGHE